MAQTTSCPPNIDFESGNFEYWQCYVGSTRAVDSVNVLLLDSAGEKKGRHTIIDAFYEHNTLDKYGKFPIVCPNGSLYSIKLGNDGVGAAAERVAYSFSIPADRKDYSLTYYYAVVFQDPGHEEYEQPRFTARVYYDTTNSVIGCATYEYIATSNLPGFKQSTVKENVWYKEWTPVTVDLSGFAGKSVRLEFTTADCTKSAHFGYAYVDVNSGCTTPITGWAYCSGAETMELHAPYGYKSYEWWNTDFSAKIGDSLSLIMTPPPPDNSSVYLDLIPFDGFGCRDTVQTLIKKESSPAAPAASDTSYCQFQKPSSLIATTSSGYRPLWYTSPTENTLIPYGALPQTDTAGITKYYVSQISQGGCEGPRTEVAVEIYKTPLTSFSINEPNQCISNNSYSFSNRTTNTDSTTKYLWNPSNGQTYPDTIPPLVVYQMPGTYKIELMAISSNICSTKYSLSAKVYDSPSPGFSANDSVQCLNKNNFRFSNTTKSNGSIFHSYWDFGDGLASTFTSASHSYTKEGIYTVKLVTANVACADSIQKLVEVNPDPLAAFSVNDARQCLDSNFFVFTDHSSISEGILHYSWMFGDGNTTSDSNSSHHYAQYNNYTVKLITESIKGCLDSFSLDIAVVPSPVIDVNLSGKPDLCVGDTLLFNASIDPVLDNVEKIQWLDNHSDIPGENNHIFKTAKEGIYTLYTENSVGCGAFSPDYIVTVNPYPSGEISSDLDYVCESKTQEIQASGGSVYRWFRNGIEIKPDSASSYFAAEAGTYRVALVSMVGCTTYLDDSVVLALVAKPQPDFEYKSQCALTKTSFIDESHNTNSGNVNYYWSFGDGYHSTLTNPVHTFSQGNITYPVSLTVTPDKCPQVPVSITKNVLIEQPLKPVRYNNAEVVAGKPITLTPRSIGMVYEWKPSTWLSDTSAMTPQFIGQKDNDYVIIITTQNGCVVTDSLLVKVYEKQEIYVPTAFTPNQDGLNDRLKPIAPSIKTIKYFRIYNRWGQLLFESFDKSGWDGNYKGIPQAPGTYVWDLAAIDFDDHLFRKKGYVVLIR